MTEEIGRCDCLFDEYGDQKQQCELHAELERVAFENGKSVVLQTLLLTRSELKSKGGPNIRGTVEILQLIVDTIKKQGREFRGGQQKASPSGRRAIREKLEIQIMQLDLVKLINFPNLGSNRYEQRADGNNQIFYDRQSQSVMSIDEVVDILNLGELHRQQAHWFLEEYERKFTATGGGY